MENGKMQIINPIETGDFHVHSATLSDGLNTIDELVVTAGRLGYSRMAVTDHNQHYMACYKFAYRTHYSIIANKRWRNIHNDVAVTFGVEADLLNEKGDLCLEIQDLTPDFVILSTHKNVYAGSPDQLKTGYLNAIRRFGDQIDCLGHLCVRAFADSLGPGDIEAIVRAANDADIALELNCANLVNGKTSIENLDVMLAHCSKLYVNSDAHTLYEFTELRQKGFDYLKSKNTPYTNGKQSR